VLVTEFKGYQNSNQYKLRPAAEEPVYAKYDALYRFLLKATHENPHMRFQDAEEMTEQLTGVMRQVVAIDTGAPCPAASAVFGPDTLGVRDVSKTGVDVRDIESLPRLKMSATDTATDFILTNLGSGDPARQTPVLQRAIEQFPDSVEALLALACNQIRLGNYEEARSNWRPSRRWTRSNGASSGIAAWPSSHRARQPKRWPLSPPATTRLPVRFRRSWASPWLPNSRGDMISALKYYDEVACTDVSYTTAVFGLARCYTKSGDRVKATDALALIPQTSSLYVDAQKKLFSRSSTRIRRHRRWTT